MEYIFSLGSNLGNRKNFIKKGTAFLSGLGRLAEKSSIYETSPLGMTGKSRPFYNSIVIIDSEFSPRNILDRIKKFEKASGRDIKSSHNQPRTIDIDILFAGKTILNSHKLHIPHREIENRKFVLMPLMEIRPYHIHPILGKSVSEMLKELKSNEKVIKISGI